MACLRYLDHQHVVRTRQLGDEHFVIGRVESCQICITDDLVSREHARLDRDPDGRYRIRDLGSRNKTIVGGERISETLLTHGDLIRIGNHVFEFLDDSFSREALDLSFLTPDRVDPAGTEWIKCQSPVTLPLDRHAHLATLGADVIHPARAEDVADHALGRLLLALRADRGLIALRGEKKKELRPVAHRGLAHVIGAGIKPVSRTFLYSAVLQAVAGRYPQSPGQVDPKSGFAAAAMVAPVLDRHNVVGVVYVDRPAPGPLFSLTDLHELMAAGAQIGTLIVETARQLAENVPAVEAPWLANMRRMQQAMSVEPQGCGSFTVATKLVSGAARCGDFCDIVPVQEQRLYVLLVDAGGQGVAGLAQANGIRTALRTALALPGSEPDPAAIVSALSRTLVARRARQLVTCTLVLLDLTQGQIRYVNAGGPPPLLLTAPGRLVTLDQPALLLGIDANYAYEAVSVDLPATFRLLCHTDGLTDMTNAAGEPLGARHVHDLLLEKDTFGDPQGIIDRIVALGKRHQAGQPQDDDALIVVVSHG